MNRPNDAPAPPPGVAVPTRGVTPVRVRYCECDPMGVAHHAAYIPWLELARTDLLRTAGVGYSQLEAAGVFLVIVKLECSYKRPALYDDLVEVRVAVVGGSRVKIRHEYEVVLREAAPAGPGAIAHTHARVPGDLLMTASTLLACVDRHGRPSALPEWLATQAAKSSGEISATTDEGLPPATSPPTSRGSPYDGVRPRYASCTFCGYQFGGMAIKGGVIVCPECGQPNAFDPGPPLNLRPDRTEYLLQAKMNRAVILIGLCVVIGVWLLSCSL